MSNNLNRRKRIYFISLLGGWNAYPQNARLYYPDNPTSRRIGAWCASTGKVTAETLQALKVDLGRSKKITHIATQGKFIVLYFVSTHTQAQAHAHAHAHAHSFAFCFREDPLHTTYYYNWRINYTYFQVEINTSKGFLNLR